MTAVVDKNNKVVENNTLLSDESPSSNIDKKKQNFGDEEDIEGLYKKRNQE